MHKELKHFLCALEPLLDYPSDIRGWMAPNFLNFKGKKRLGSCFLNPVAPAVSLTFDFSSLAIHEKSSITNLGVKMDPSLKLNRHMQVESSLFLSAFS